MRGISILPAFLAASLVATVALAANDKAVATFIAQESSGVSGQATLTALPPGGTVVHGKIQGLEANVEYVAQAYTDGACGTGSAVELARFRANPNGVAILNARTDKPIADIKSISVQLAANMSLKACAEVTP